MKQKRQYLELPLFAHQPRPYQGPSRDEVSRLRKRFVNPAVFSYYQEPLMMVEGSMQYLFDEKGRRYLDGFGGIVSVSVGHGHPQVMQAAREQMEVLQHTTTIYLHPVMVAYAQMLAGRLPGDLSVCYFVNSGSEANDLALLMARAYTGNYDVIVLRNGYHGGNLSGMGLTSHHTWKYNVPHSFGVHHAVAPDPYRGVFGRDDPEAGSKYAEDVKALIAYATSGQVAGFFAESVQGVGGVVPYPPGYLQEVYQSVRAAGGVCVADEVQTGLGRTGAHFWGFEAQGVVPDIVCLAKGLGNGCALGAVVTRPEIARALEGRLHFNTFGGNPVSCAQGKAVLEVIEQEGMQANAEEVGRRLCAGLLRLKEKHALIGDIRGSGLMIGVDLVKDRETKEPAASECAQVFEYCRELGLLLGKSGLEGNVLRMTPPMCITIEDADFILEVLDASLSRI